MPKGLSRKAVAEYMSAYRDGIADARAGIQARSSRLWSRAYRWGYSDGYARGKK